MRENIELTEIGKKLLDADSVLIFPHVNPDGDAIGSTVALCLALRQKGKKSYVYSKGQHPNYLNFLRTDVIVDDLEDIEDLGTPDVCIALDCSTNDRLKERMETYEKGKTRLCIDHHENEEVPFEDDECEFYIDEKAAATCQLSYSLLKKMDVYFEKDIANALYTGLSTDTRNFLHSNTTPEVHRIAADLMDMKVDHNSIMVALYQNRSLEKIQCEAKALEKVELIADGKGAITWLTKAEMEAKGWIKEHADEVIDAIRIIKDVEMAAYLEERDDGIKASMRSKTSTEVLSICKKYDGGGHIKAAGCTMHMTMEEAIKTITKDIEEALKDF